jgi:flavin-dependent dehydrogenase
MINPKTESDIKLVKEFLEFWGKLHSLYSSTIAKERITKEDEGAFIRAKSALKAKYDTLKVSLEFKYMPHMRLTDPVEDILALDGMHFMSEKNLKKLEDDWRDSYVFLNSILERLKNNRKRFEQFNPVGVFLKKIFDRR